MKNKKIKFVDVRNYGFITEPRYYFYGWSKSSKVLGRDSVVKALIKARRFLPKGYNFKIWDCQRPRKVQIEMIKSFKKRLRLMRPKLSEKEIKKLVFKFCAYPLKRVTRLDTHRRGGSFDLTIINQCGEKLYMGADFDDLTEKAKTDYFEKKKRLNTMEKIAKKNRRLLKKVLTKTGFKNFPLEWWHWSYDK